MLQRNNRNKNKSHFVSMVTQVHSSSHTCTHVSGSSLTSRATGTHHRSLWHGLSLNRGQRIRDSNSFLSQNWRFSIANSKTSWPINPILLLQEGKHTHEWYSSYHQRNILETQENVKTEVVSKITNVILRQGKIARENPTHHRGL